MKILFIGCVKLSEDLLRTLILKDIHICGVITKKTSTFNSDFKDLGSYCEKKKIDFHYTKNINSKVTIKWAEKKNPDFIFCFGWSEILSKDILSIPKKYTVGYHPSLLPYFRGRHPIIWAILLGLKKTGSSFFIMDETVDNGPLVSQKSIKIDANETAESLYKKITSIAIFQMDNLIINIKNNKFKNNKVNKTKYPSLRKRTLNDGSIDWRMNSEIISRHVRALSKPYPGAQFVYNKKIFKVWNIKIIKDDSNVEPGKIIAIKDNKPIIKCSNAAIKILSYEPTIKFVKGKYL